jgi:hypothetical protein
VSGTVELRNGPFCPESLPYPYTTEAVKASALEREAFKTTTQGVFLLSLIEKFSVEQLRELIMTMNMEDIKRREKIDVLLMDFPVAHARVRAAFEDEARAYAQ